MRAEVAKLTRYWQRLQWISLLAVVVSGAWWGDSIARHKSWPIWVLAWVALYVSVTVHQLALSRYAHARGVLDELTRAGIR